jgi:hypothetical protein
MLGWETEAVSSQELTVHGPPWGHTHSSSISPRKALGAEPFGTGEALICHFTSVALQSWGWVSSLSGTYYGFRYYSKHCTTGKN